MKPLAIVCPSRGRPFTAVRMILSALENSSADILIYADSDDPELGGYSPSNNLRVFVHVGPPVGRGAAVNELIRRHPDYRMYLIVSDDITFVRNDWEAQVIAAMDSFGDDIGLVHLASETSERYVNWACVSKKWIDTLGWFNYPECRDFCQDTILQVLAEALGRIVFIEPQVIHHDCIASPDNLQRLARDQDRFLWYMAKEFGGDLAKLRAKIDEEARERARWAIPRYEVTLEEAQRMAKANES